MSGRSDSGQRKMLRPIGTLLTAGLISLTLIAPASSTEPEQSGELVDSLIVKYEPGASIRDSSGDPNGSDSVETNVDLQIGENLGLGYRTIKFDQPIPIEEAEKIAAQLDDSSAVAIAEPNGKIFALDLDQFATLTQADLPINNWNLDLLDQTNSVGDGMYTYSSSGTGVNAYVVDSGIRATHSEFSSVSGTRIQVGINFAADKLQTDTNDCHGHGTHVAGTLGGTTFGVAKSVNLYPIRVLRCDGTGDVSWTVSALNWIKQNAVKPAVVNMSIGTYGDSSTVNSLVADLVSSGITVVVASGNGITDQDGNFIRKTDACEFSPAKEPSAITVNSAGAANSGLLSPFSPSYFSNYGSCSDIYAPGFQIKSAYKTNDQSTAILNGTSMAAPLVAGVVANILSESPLATPAQIQTMINAEAASVVTPVITGDPSIFIHQPGDGWIASIKSNSALQLLTEQQAAAAQAVAAEAARVAAEQAAAKAAVEAEAARVAAEKDTMFAQAQNTLSATAKKRVISVTVSAPAGSRTNIQLLTNVKVKVAYQKAYKVREKYQVVNSKGKTVTKYRSVTKYKTAYRTVTDKQWRTVNSSPSVALYSWKAKKAGSYRAQVVTPYGTADGNSFRVR